MADTARRKGRAVPLTRRLLAARPVRTAAGALGVGLALMLILLLSGLWEGVQQRVTVYEDHLGAGLVVVPPGTESLFADPGALSAAAAGAIRRTPGVAAADPVHTLYLILELPHGKAAVAAVASDPGRPGGPWALAAGRPPQAVDEVALDAVFAGEHGLVIGDQLPVLGGVVLRDLATPARGHAAPVAAGLVYVPCVDFGQAGGEENLAPRAPSCPRRMP